MKTKKEKKDKGPAVMHPKVTIPFGCFVWTTRMIVDNALTEVYVVIDGDGKIISSEDRKGEFISLPLIKPDNKGNAVYKKSVRQELGKQYGFTKKD